MSAHPLDSPAPAPWQLRGLAFSLVGPGRVGESLARWAVAAGARMVAVAGRGGGAGAGREPALAGALGAVAVPLDALATAGQDLLLVAVPDPALAEVAAALAARPQARVALHTSGSLDAAVLAPLRGGGSPAGSATGTAVGSLHPLMAFPHPLTDPEAARGKVFALDGDAEAEALGRRLAAAWGGVPVVVPPAARAAYHLAASLAAGGVVTLLALAAELAGRLGLPPETTAGYLELARGALAAAQDAGDPGRALTGPAARGDLATLRRHLEALADVAPERLPLVEELARETLRQCERAGPLGEAQRRLLEELGKTEREVI